MIIFIIMIIGAKVCMCLLFMRNFTTDKWCHSLVSFYWILNLINCLIFFNTLFFSCSIIRTISFHRTTSGSFQFLLEFIWNLSKMSWSFTTTNIFKEYRKMCVLWLLTHIIFFKYRALAREDWTFPIFVKVDVIPHSSVKALLKCT